MTQKHKDEIISRIIKFNTKQPLPKAVCGCENPVFPILEIRGCCRCIKHFIMTFYLTERKIFLWQLSENGETLIR